MALTAVNWNATAATNRTAIQAALDGGTDGARLVYDPVHPIFEVDVANDPASTEVQNDLTDGHLGWRGNIQSAIWMRDGKRLFLDSGVTLLTKAGSFHSSGSHLVIAYHDSGTSGVACNNITIDGGVGSALKMLIADYNGAGYKRSTGADAGVRSEFRHCVGLYGTTNPVINVPSILDSGGDSVYVGPDEPWTGIYPSGSYAPNSSVPCQNVTVNGVVASNPTRNGISVISVSGLNVTNCQCSGAVTLNPRGGIVFEPDNGHQVLNSIVVNNCLFASDYLYGIGIEFANMDGSSAVDMLFQNCVVTGSTGQALYYHAGAMGPAIGSVVKFQTVSMIGNSYCGPRIAWTYPHQTTLSFQGLRISGGTYPVVFVFTNEPTTPGAGTVRFADTEVADSLDRALVFIEPTVPTAVSNQVLGTIGWRPGGTSSTAQAVAKLPSLQFARRLANISGRGKVSRRNR